MNMNREELLFFESIEEENNKQPEERYSNEDNIRHEHQATSVACSADLETVGADFGSVSMRHCPARIARPLARIAVARV
jgi:hypothetical protein